MVTLTIDGKTARVPAGTTILEAAQQVGIRIPTLCWLQKVSPTGACRICVVDIAGVDRPMTACNTPVKEGIVVTTQNEKLTALRKQVVELLLINHPLDCPVCDAAGECDLQNICYELDVTRQPFAAEDVNPPAINNWPLIQQVPSRCVLCEKCVKVCHETVGSSALFVNGQGDRSFIDKQLELCEFCGSCVSVCPTGTMISKPFKFKARPWELTKVPSVCSYCPSQCQIDLNVKQGKVLRVTSEDDKTINDGNLCIGGFFGYGYADSPKRLTRPQLRIGVTARDCSWDEALDLIVEKISALGASAVAALGSARLTNEENYLLQKLLRVAIGSNNLDSEARFGTLRVVKALQSVLGSYGASNRLASIGQADAVLVFGADVTAETPALDWQIEQACRQRDGKLIVANMRKVKLVRYANTHLAYQPGTEIALAEALAKLMVENGWVDEAYLQQYVSNADDIKNQLKAVNLEKAAETTGLSLELLEEAARYLGQAKNVAILMGADLARSEGAEEKALAVANLAILCGALGSESGGVFPLDEKGNIQGLLDMGMAADLLPGGSDYAAAKAGFEQAWGTSLPDQGRTAQGILEGIEQGQIKILYLAGTNPLVSYPDSGRWLKALEKVETLIIQDILATELTEMATVVLPAAADGEKLGSLTSLDHQLSKLGKVREPLGEAKDDLSIFAALYQRLAPPGTADCSLAAVIAEIKELVPGYAPQACCSGGRCRPTLREPFRPKEQGLIFSKVKAPAAPQAGLRLLSGKILFHFGTTSTFAEANRTVAPSGYLEMNPEDAKSNGLKEGDTVKVTSAVGSAKGLLRLSDRVPPGLVFAPYHFADLNIQQVLPSAANLVDIQVSKA